MNGELPDEWSPLLDSLVTASTIIQAAEAASDLADEAVPGRAALSDRAALLVRAIANRNDDVVRSANRAWVVAVLLAVAERVGVWRRVVAGGRTSPQLLAHAATEADTAHELAEACRELAVLAQDTDPEVRGVMYLLLGAAGRPVSAVARELEIHVGDDGDLRARACAVQGLVKVLLRLPDPEAAEVATRVSALVDGGPGDYQARMEAEARAGWYTVDQRERMSELLGRSVRFVVEPPDLWPAESI